MLSDHLANTASLGNHQASRRSFVELNSEFAQILKQHSSVMFVATTRSKLSGLNHKSNLQLSCMVKCSPCFHILRPKLQSYPVFSWNSTPFRAATWNLFSEVTYTNSFCEVCDLTMPAIIDGCFSVFISQFFASAQNPSYFVFFPGHGTSLRSKIVQMSSGSISRNCLSLVPTVGSK